MSRHVRAVIPPPLPARRTAALGAAVALAAGAAGFVPAAHAMPAPATAATGGTAGATVLRADLDVSLLNRTVGVPVHASLNDVRAPGDAEETALTVTVGHGVEAGRPVALLRATAATANATAGPGVAEGYANLVNARVHLPGLPLLSLVSVDAATSHATCRAGRTPTASSHLAGVTVLGRHVALGAVGTTRIDVPGVGRVDLVLTHTAVTSATAAATALHLAVHVNPLGLGVAEVSGDVTLVRASCRTPQSGGGTTSGGTADGGTSNGGSSNGGAVGGSSGNGGSTAGGSTAGTANGGAANGGSAGGTSNGGRASGGSGVAGANGSSGAAGSTASGGGASGGSAGGGDARSQSAGATGDLAETGAGSSTPYVAAGAVALVVAGGGAVLVAGRRRGNRGSGA